MGSTATINTANTGDTMYPLVINQALYILQRQSGQSDNGNYEIGGNSYTATSSFQSAYVQSRSRNSVPVSVTIDSGIDAGSGLGSLSVGNITAGGAQVFATVTASQANAHMGGNATFNY